MNRDSAAYLESWSVHRSRGKFLNGSFVFPIRVFYEDTDAAGIVYYANYLKFLERARTEMLRGVGLNHIDLLNKHKLMFVVRRCLVEYLAAARLDDLIEIHTKVLCLKGASLNIEQVVFRQEQKLVESKLTLACVSELGVPKRLPPVLRTMLDDLQL